MAKATLTEMLSEEEFLEHAASQTVMSEDEYLEHYGKKGMKWGQKTADYALGTLGKSRNARNDNGGGKQTKAQRNDAIDKARDRIDSGANAKRYEAAQTKFRDAKGDYRKGAAKAAFEAVKDKNMDDYHDSTLAKSGKEKAGVALLTAGAIVLVAAVSRI